MTNEEVLQKVLEKRLFWKTTIWKRRNERMSRIRMVCKIDVAEGTVQGRNRGERARLRCISPIIECAHLFNLFTWRSEEEGRGRGDRRKKSSD